MEVRVDPSAVLLGEVLNRSWDTAPGITWNEAVSAELKPPAAVAVRMYLWLVSPARLTLGEKVATPLLGVADVATVSVAPLTPVPLLIERKTLLDAVVTIFPWASVRSN